jgi:hypothetical protein
LIRYEHILKIDSAPTYWIVFELKLNYKSSLFVLYNPLNDLNLLMKIIGIKSSPIVALASTDHTSPLIFWICIKHLVDFYRIINCHCRTTCIVHCYNKQWRVVWWQSIKS